MEETENEETNGVKSRQKTTPSAYRSSVLEILGLSSPADTAANTRIIEPNRPVPSFEDIETDLVTPRPVSPQTPAGDEVVEDERDLVQRLWTATEVSGDLGIDDWAPETPIDRAIGRYRWAWWPVLIGVLAVGLFLVVATLRGIPEGQANDLRAEWLVDIAELEADLPSARAATEIITAPSPGPIRLTNARASLIGFSTSGSAIDAAISESFPSPPPLASSSAFDELVPIQDDLRRAVELTESIDDNLADALTYRELVNQSFKLPNLPISGDELTIDDLGRQIASVLSFSRDSADQLPTSPEYLQHSAAVRALIDRLESWQASYLDALRLGDIDTATALKIEITDRTEQVKSTIGEPLAAVAVTVDAQLDELQQLLATAKTGLAVG